MRQYLAGYRVYLGSSLLIITVLGLALLVSHSLGADPLCGNGSIDSPSEECDDGNTADGDCCSATCKLDPIGTHCDHHSVCAEEGACNGVGICIDLGCRVGARCSGGGCAPAKYCEYPSGGPCSCTASTSTPFPDCAQLTGDIDDQALIDAEASLEAKGLDISEVVSDDSFWILITELSPIVGCDMQ